MATAQPEEQHPSQQEPGPSAVQATHTLRVQETDMDMLMSTRSGCCSRMCTRVHTLPPTRVHIRTGMQSQPVLRTRACAHAPPAHTLMHRPAVPPLCAHARTQARAHLCLLHRWEGKRNFWDPPLEFLSHLSPQAQSPACR